MLASRPVVAFALLRQCSEVMRTDLLSGIAILIRPLIADLTDQLFDSRILSERLGSAYGVSIPHSALEGMTYRLVAAGILRVEQLESGLSRVHYSAEQESTSIEPNSEAHFQTILDEFVKHANDRLSVLSKIIPSDDLTAGFLRRLATLDFSAIKARPAAIPDAGKKIVGPAAREQIALSEELASEAILDALVASYIASLQEHQPSRLDLLAQVADGALAAELVFDLQAPTSVSRLANTTVVVDTPLILSYLDLSSSQDTIDARKLFNQIRETGAKIAAFQHSIDEAEGVLKAIQNAREAGDAYGPSVHRLSHSTFRAYFESMIGAIARSWTQTHHLEIIAEAATHYHKNFTIVEEEELVGAIRMSMFDRVLTRERDAKSVAETIRRLGGAHVPVSSISSCRFIFATSNASLQRRVASFLNKKKFVLEGEFNPIITSRYLSGLCWLICGGKSDQSPTLAKLLANCAAALRLKPEISDRTKRFLADIDLEKARHFEALMTNERAAQYLAEVTLGDANAITANNVEDIYEEVQRRAAEKVAIEKDNEYKGQIAALRSSIEATELDAEKLRSSLIDTQLEIDARKIETRDISQRASDLQSQYSESLERLTAQQRQLEELNTEAYAARTKAEEAQSLLEKQRALGRQSAGKYADRRASQIRWIGVVAFFCLAFGTGYIDKFLAPQLTTSVQHNANLAILCVQTLLALLGIASIFNPLVKKPVKWIRRKLYKSRLEEMGIPEN